MDRGVVSDPFRLRERRIPALPCNKMPAAGHGDTCPWSTRCRPCKIVRAPGGRLTAPSDRVFGLVPLSLGGWSWLPPKLVGRERVRFWAHHAAGEHSHAPLSPPVPPPPPSLARAPKSQAVAVNLWYPKREKRACRTQPTTPALGAPSTANAAMPGPGPRDPSDEASVKSARGKPKCVRLDLGQRPLGLAKSGRSWVPPPKETGTGWLEWRYSLAAVGDVQRVCAHASSRPIGLGSPRPPISPPCFQTEVSVQAPSNTDTSQCTVTTLDIGYMVIPLLNVVQLIQAKHSTGSNPG